MVDAGPAQSPVTVYLEEHLDEFETRYDDQNDLTGGNLKMLAWGLQALAQDESKTEDEDVALDVRPVLMQASNLLVREPWDNSYAESMVHRESTPEK